MASRFEKKRELTTEQAKKRLIALFVVMIILITVIGQVICYFGGQVEQQIQPQTQTEQNG